MNHKRPQYTKSKFKNVFLLFYLLWQYWKSLVQAVIPNQAAPCFMVKYQFLCRTRGNVEPGFLPPNTRYNSCPGLELNCSSWSRLLPRCCHRRGEGSTATRAHLHGKAVIQALRFKRTRRQAHLEQCTGRQSVQKDILQYIYKPAMVPNSCVNWGIRQCFSGSAKAQVRGPCNTDPTATQTPCTLSVS